MFANGLWYTLALRDAVAYRRALGDVQGSQDRLLLNLLRRNARTEYGRRHGFSMIRSPSEYQRQVPLTTYEDYAEAVGRIASGDQGVLTADRVLLLEPTGGSVGGTKYIPYTAALKAEFQRAIAPWIVDLFGDYRRLLHGQAYWSLTPVARRNEYTLGGIPVGFEDDTEYLGRLSGKLHRSVMAVPPEVRLIPDMEAFQYVTLLFLVRSRRLSLISVWNPTFLTLLLDRLSEWWPSLASDIGHGTLSPPAPLPYDVRSRLRMLNKADPQRAAEVRSTFSSEERPRVAVSQLWPHLRLISCWTDAHAEVHLPEVQRLFPSVAIQGKGLIATECLVSFPLVGHPGAALAIRSHFFEFLPVGGGWARLAHELEVGAVYSVVVTTSGGLYRYRLQDRVEVVGHVGQCPLLRFRGKEDQVSDRFGEKLNERHVRDSLQTLLSRHRLKPDFAMVAYDEQAAGRAYTLFIQAESASDGVLTALAAELDTLLCRNYHYRYCRSLGQLGPLRVFRVQSGALEEYFSVSRALGQRVGDIKPVALHSWGGWSMAFRGALVR